MLKRGLELWSLVRQHFSPVASPSPAMRIWYDTVKNVNMIGMTGTNVNVSVVCPDWLLNNILFSFSTNRHCCDRRQLNINAMLKFNHTDNVAFLILPCMTFLITERIYFLLYYNLLPVFGLTPGFTVLCTSMTRQSRQYRRWTHKDPIDPCWSVTIT